MLTLDEEQYLCNFLRVPFIKSHLKTISWMEHNITSFIRDKSPCANFISPAAKYHVMTNVIIGGEYVLCHPVKEVVCSNQQQLLHSLWTRGGIEGGRHQLMF